MKRTAAVKAGLSRRHFLKLSAATGAAAAMGAHALAMAQQVRTWRFGHMMPPDSIYHKAIVMFADQVAKLSSNKIKVDIFPSSQLGSISDMLRSVQAGSLTMTMAVPAWYGNFVKPLDVFTLPYLVSSPDRLRRALSGAMGNEVSRLAESAGFKVMGYWLMGERHIVNKVRAVQTPADCRGLKIRVINSQAYMQTFRALGANPVAMDPSELYLALQQGVVDGFDNDLPDVVAFKFYEVSKYLSLDAHTTDFMFNSVNMGIWNGLSSEERGIMSKAMETAVDYQWKAQPEEIDSSLVKLKTLMQVNEISPEAKKLFVEATRPVYAQFESSIGKSFLELAMRELQ